MSLPVFLLLDPYKTLYIECGIVPNRLTISISRESCFVEMYQNISVFAYFPFPQGLQFTNTFPILSRYHTGCINVFAARVPVVFHAGGSGREQEILRSTIHSTIRCLSENWEIWEPIMSSSFSTILILCDIQREENLHIKSRDSGILVDLITGLSTYTKLRFIFSRGKLA